MAVVILEVLAGRRTPAEAAALLGVGPPRYYQLETRALQGLVRPWSRAQGQAAFAGRPHRAVGKALAGIPPRVCAATGPGPCGAAQPGDQGAGGHREGKPADKDRRGRRKRRPTVRALKAARTLAAQARAAEADGVQPELSTVRSSAAG